MTWVYYKDDDMACETGQLLECAYFNKKTEHSTVVTFVLPVSFPCCFFFGEQSIFNSNLYQYSVTLINFLKMAKSLWVPQPTENRDGS